MNTPQTASPAKHVSSGTPVVTVYTTDFIRYLASSHGRSRAYYRQAITEILDGMTEQLVNGRRVQLIGFGTFYTREQPAGTVRGVQTGCIQIVPARRVAAFRGGSS